jgi:hypothetical protein
MVAAKLEDYRRGVKENSGSESTRIESRLEQQLA